MRMLIIAVLLAASLVGGTWIYFQHPKFGKTADGVRLEAIKRSPNYSGEGFQNLIPTPVLADDRSFPLSTIAYVSELQRDWSRPTADEIAKLFAEHGGGFGQGLRWEWLLLGLKEGTR